MKNHKYLAEVVFCEKKTRASIYSWNHKPVKAHFPCGEDDLGDTYVSTFNDKADCVRYIRALCNDKITINDCTKTPYGPAGGDKI